MKLPRTASLAIAALCLALGQSPAVAQDAPEPANASQNQTTELEGKWEGTEKGGESKGTCTLTVKGNSIDFRGADKREWYKATFTLPAGTDPKQLHGTITESPAAEFVGKTGVSIYKIENGTLTLVGSKPGKSEVPTSFQDESGTRTFILKKVSASKE